MKDLIRFKSKTDKENVMRHYRLGKYKNMTNNASDFRFAEITDGSRLWDPADSPDPINTKNREVPLQQCWASSRFDEWRAFWGKDWYKRKVLNQSHPWYDYPC
jgi:hypothetical protein